MQPATHTDFYVGLQLAGALGFLAAGSFFVQAWRHRRDEKEYLIAGAMTAVLAVMGSAGALSFWHAAYETRSPLSLQVLSTITVAGGILATALVVHFTVQYLRLRHGRLINGVAYAFAVAFELMLALDLWWHKVESHPAGVTIFGLDLPRIDLEATAPTMLFYYGAPLCIGGTAVLFVREYLQGRRELLGTVIGSGALAFAAFNDAVGIGANAFPTARLVPFGFAVFIYGVGLTLLNRYGLLSRQLERRTDALRDRSEQLIDSLDELKRTQAELVRREQLAAIGELAAVIAHEVRNPLAIVGNAVASLRRGHLSEGDRAQLLAIIDEEMVRLERLVSGLLHYSRPVVVQHEAIVLEDLVRRSLAVLASDEDVRAAVRAGETITVYGDANLLRLAFENVVRNASQAMNGKGELQVTIDERDRDGVPIVAVAFADRGEGMTSEQITQALSPFFTTRPTGTGLGLPICERIVEAHGGELAIESSTGVGTTVTFLLPASPDRLLRPPPSNPSLALPP